MRIVAATLWALYLVPLALNWILPPGIRVCVLSGMLGLPAGLGASPVVAAIVLWYGGPWIDLPPAFEVYVWSAVLCPVVAAITIVGAFVFFGIRGKLFGSRSG